jgi:hypothetical protein
MLLGDFNGDHSTDILAYGTCKEIDATPSKTCKNLGVSVPSNQLDDVEVFFFWSSAGSAPLAIRSLYPVK